MIRADHHGVCSDCEPVNPSVFQSLIALPTKSFWRGNQFQRTGPRRYNEGAPAGREDERGVRWVLRGLLLQGVSAVICSGRGLAGGGGVLHPARR